MSHRPQLWVIAGPNGSGKTTLTERYFKGRLPVINPDEIAKHLDSTHSSIAIQGGRLATKQRQQ